MVNDLPNAEKHLAALRGICLLPCEELEDLETRGRRLQSQAAGLIGYCANLADKMIE